MPFIIGVNMQLYTYLQRTKELVAIDRFSTQFLSILLSLLAQNIARKDRDSKQRK